VLRAAGRLLLTGFARDPAMKDRLHRVPFPGTGNAARSRMAGALLNVPGEGRFRGSGAAGRPAGHVQPPPAKLVAEPRYAPPRRSTSWDGCAGPAAPDPDFIAAACDKAAGDACPVRRGQPVPAHGGMPDPAATPDDLPAFMHAWATRRRRIERWLAPPLGSFDAVVRARKRRAIGAA